MQNRFKYWFRLCCVLVMAVPSAVANAEQLSLDELLSKMREGLPAEGSSFHFQVEEYLTSPTLNQSEPLLFQQIDVITDGVRTRVDTKSSPRSLDKNPLFGVKTTEVYDGELYKKLTIYKK